jgi:hypothetical protein
MGVVELICGIIFVAIMVWLFFALLPIIIPVILFLLAICLFIGIGYMIVAVFAAIFGG